MALNCITPDPTRQRYGFSESFVEGLKDTFGSITNVRQARNIARNLGLDAEDAVNLTQKGKQGKVFGRNLKTIEEYDAVRAKDGAVPNNTIVAVPDLDGGNIQHFVSNSKTTIYPSRWVEQPNGLAPNPHWDALGVNQTLNNEGQLQGFVRDKTGTYRLPREGETPQYFLNVQKAVQGDEPLPREYLAKHNIDAYEVRPNEYRLVNEHAQTVPIRQADQPNNRDVIGADNVEEAISAPQIEEKLIRDGLPHALARTVAGGIAGALVDEDGEHGGAFWGGALGFFLGSPRVRTKVRGVFSRTGKKSDDAYNDFARTAEAHENKMQRIDALKREGFEGDPDSQQAEEFLREVVLPRRQARNEGRLGTKTIFDNTWFKSGIEDLRRLGSDTAESTLQFFRQIEHSPKRLYAKFSNKVEEVLGTRDTKTALDQSQIQYMRRNFGEDLTEQQALDSFGAAVKRIITHGADVEGGEFRYVSDIAADRVYQNMEVRRIDEGILRDEQASQIVRVFREWSDEVGTELKDALNAEIERAIQRPLSEGGIDGQFKQLARQIRDSGVDEREFRSANPELSKQLRTAKKTSEFDRFLEQHNKWHAIDRLGGRYFPQKFDMQKARRVRQQWEADNVEDINRYVEDVQAHNREHGLPFRDRSDLVEEAWYRKQASDILAMNRDQWRLLDFDTSTHAVGEKLFNTRGRAIRQLERYLNENLDEADFGVITANRNNLDDFVRTRTIDGQERYFLEVPERYREMGNVFQENNVSRVAASQRELSLDVAIQKSNHFDNPRNYVLPSQYLQTNLDALVRSYSNDVGPRLTGIQNGIYDKKQFDNVLAKIREEASPNAKTQVAKTQLNESLANIKTWYKTIQGWKKDIKVDPNREGRRALQTQHYNDIKNDLIWNALGKIATAPFLYATSFYAPLQMAVLGPFLYGWRNTFSAYKTALTNPQELKAMSQELRKMNHIYDAIEAYSPERSSRFRKEALGEQLTPSLERMFNVADRMESFAANFSLTRMLAGKNALALDNTGIFRLFGGNLLDVSGAEASLSALGAMRHMEDLVEAGARLRNNPQGSVRINGIDYDMPRVRRELEDLAIDDVDRFIREKDSFNAYSDRLAGTGKAEPSDWMYGQMTQALGEAVNNYHGKGKLVRPLAWLNNPFGRALSQFSTYTQNFGIQTTRTRIYLPFRDWNSRYGGAMKEDAPMFRLMLEGARGNDAYFKRVFGDQWEGAYNDFPVYAMNNFFKVFGALGVGKALLIGRAGVMDILEMTSNEALGNEDYEAWRGVNRQLSLGFRKEDGEWATIGDVFNGDIDGWETFKMFRAGLETTTRLGFAGPATQKVLDLVQYDQDPLSMFPIGSSIDGILEIMTNMYRTPIEQMPREVGKDILDFGLLHTPPIGTMHGMRQSISDFVIQKPQNRTSVQDVETGQAGDIHYIDF